MKKKLLLLDAYALIYRAYYAFIKNPRINSKGTNTSAIYGFTNTLLDVLSNTNPSHIGVVFDTPEPTFRHKLYAEYKANRPPTPEDIRASIPVIKEIIRGFNISIIEKNGFEADDIIATLAHKAPEDTFDVYMMTPDKDFCQAVKKNVFLYKPRRMGNQIEVLGIEEVTKKYEIDTPQQFIDILALWGDSSDNIPGAKGIGEKTSKTLLARFGSINGIYENIEKLKGKQKENLIASKENVYLSKKLATIELNCPVDFNETALQLTTPNFEKLNQLFTELEFKTILNRIGKKFHKTGEFVQKNLFEETITIETPPKTLKTLSDTEHNYVLLDSAEKRKELLCKLENTKEFCFDTETTGLDVHSAEIVGISFSLEKNNAYYIPFTKDREQTTNTLSEFKHIFLNEEISKIGQNIKFDILILHQYGIEVKGNLFDTLIAHYLLYPEMPHNLDFLAETYLDYQTVSIESLIGKKGKSQRTMRSVPIKLATDYACEDADISLQLKSFFEPMLKEENLYNLFTTIEMPLIKVLTKMEINGVSISETALKEYSDELIEKIKQIKQKIIDLAGVEFNIASPKQLGEILFERLKIVDKPKRTKTKQYSTSESELTKLIDSHEIIPLILEFRTLNKLLNTYADSLPKLINSRTNKIHTSFNQSVTSTGRLSSTNPNLQNIPIRTAEGKRIRKAFVPENENNLLVAADYSQIELRLMAHLSEDKNMINAFLNNEDIHTATAAKINKIEHSEVSKEMRSQAKSANFGIIYGISAFGLAQNLKIKRSEAKRLIDGYFNTYPKVKEYMAQCIENARKNQAVETLFGRKRRLKDIDSANRVVKGIAERNAINAPIQGSAADIIKIAMLKIQSEIEVGRLQAKIILQVHDELVLDVPAAEVETIKEILTREMENAAQLKIPLKVDIGVGKNWLEAH